MLDDFPSVQAIYHALASAFLLFAINIRIGLGYLLISYAQPKSRVSSLLWCSRQCMLETSILVMMLMCI